VVGADLAAHEATTVVKLIWLVPAIPLAVAAINLVAGRRLRTLAGWLASLAVATSFAVAALTVRDLLTLPADERLFVVHLFDWIRVGRFDVGADLRLDVVSATMILVVTGIGTLIHVYAIGYMEGDVRFGRFFSYLNLFVAFMLLLVLGDNLLLLYLGWEGVGLCSYLLIGFWFEDPNNANAAKKAFVTTRIGDTAMLLGLAFLAVKFGTLEIGSILGGAGEVLTKGTATVIALLLFAGAVGKSAQVPLHVWLPDAMAGPTPVSALIHAATMVTAGVYLVVRMHLLFEVSGTALTVVAVVGLVTAVYAGTCAFGQDDIKRVLAYSTISQLGFMFLAAGLRAYSVALFFLVVHAFYKALMFLGAGSVLHGMHDETDLKQMGGLRRRMPITAITLAVGAFALSGLPPLSGFFAKDLVLDVANSNGRWGYYVFGLVGALLSSLYIGRLLFLAFPGRPRSEVADHAHESPPLMWVPLVILSVGAAAAGLLSLTADGPLIRFLEPATGPIPEGNVGLGRVVFISIALIASVAGLLVTWFVYGSGRVDWFALRARLQPIPRLLANGWYVDRLYQTVVAAPGKAFAMFLANVVDLRVIDGSVNGIGRSVRGLAETGRRLQTGFVREYALALFAGTVGILVYLGFRL
jgi:NADH-quinone oxidoreductase subunit L